MAEPTLMVRFKDGAKWPRKPAAYTSTGRVRKGAIWPGPIDKAGNKITVELAPDIPYYYEIRIEKDGSTRYQPAGRNHTDAEAHRLRMIEKKDVKVQAKNLGMTVIDPEESKTLRPTLKDTAELYIEDCRKRNVLEAMEQACLVTAEFLTLTHLTYTDEVTRDAILTFDDELRKLGREARTIRNKRQRLQSWFRFAGIDAKLFPGKPRIVKTIPTIYEPYQIKRLMAAADKHQHMACSLMLKLGLRDGEAQHSEWTDVLWTDRLFQVQSKPRFNWTVKDWEDRLIPIGDDLYAELEEWRARNPKDTLIIPTRHGNPNGKLLAMLKGLARKAGLGCGKCANCIKKVTGQIGCDDYYLHKFRATYITSLFRAGFDPVTIMRYAGHENLQTTMAYARPASGKSGVAAVSGISWEG